MTETPTQGGQNGRAGLDALFLHAPRFEGRRREIMVLPAGVPALANLLAEEGFRVEIVHLGIESEVGPGFSLRRYLEERQPRLVLVPLHWSLQTRPALDVAERVRAWLPGAPIYLGGLTASAFAAEIVASVRFVDGVVRGDGEEPVRLLARAVLAGSGSLEAVPNLLWRDPRTGGLRSNGMGFRLDGAYAGRLRHGSLALLRNREAYVGRALYADFSPRDAAEAGYARATYLNAIEV